MRSELKSQLIRASSSIVLNLAEGSGKRTTKDRRKFFDISYGSFKETEAILDLTGNLSGEMQNLVNKVGAHLWKLLQYYKSML